MNGKILIVDDDLDTLKLVGTLLERQGYQIVAANSGPKALEKAQVEKPSLILLDVMMPGMDGYEVTQKLRAQESTAFIPIIMFTAKAQVDDKVEGFQSGVDDYLTKPTHPAELIARVKTILNRPQSSVPAVEGAGSNHKPGEVIGLLSAKGGLGVSTLALNLGVSIYNQTDEYVTVAEFRPGQGGVGFFLGYPQAVGLSNLLQMNPMEITPEAVKNELVTHGSGIQLLLSSYRPSDIELLNAVDQFIAIVEALVDLAAYSVLDLGAGFPKATQKIVPLCSKLFVVLEPTRHSITQTKALLDELVQRGMNKNNLEIVLVNRVRLEISMPASQVQQELGYRLSGVITPAPELIHQASGRREPLILVQPDSLSAQQIDKLAKVAVAQEKVMWR